MASTYGNDLRLEEIGDGEQSGSWGATTNTNLELIAEALSFGTEAITTNANTHTTTIADGATDPGRSLYLKYTGTLDSTCTITIAPNSISKTWYIENGTGGSQSIIISQGSGANVTIPTGQTKIVYSDGAGSGAAMAEIGTLGVTNLNVSGDITVGDDLTVTDDAAIGGALTVTGVLTGTSLDISGNVDIDGTTNLDAVDIDGAVQIDATVNVGVDDTGYDVKFFGDTASAYMQWDASADDLILGGAAGIVVPDGKLTLGSTAVTSTGAELNILDGVTSTATELNQLDAITRGSILYGNASGATARLAAGGAGTVLTSDGTDLSFAAAASSSTGFFLNALQKNIAARTGGIDIVVDALLDQSGIANSDEAGYVSGSLTLSTAETTHPDPVLTSNTAPSPYVASAQYGNSASAYRAWLNNSGSYFDNYNSTTQWIQLDIGSAKVATSYRLAPSFTGTYNTTNHTFSGSNSADGSSSTTLATGSTASSSYRTFSNSTAFRYYRINATGNGGFGTGQVWQNNAVKTTKNYPFNIETVSYATGSVKTSVTVGVYATTTGSETLNTTLKALVSRDGGSNYTTSSTLSLKTTTPDGKKYFQADDVDISGIASGTNLKLKIVVTNNTCTALHGWVLDWS